MADLSRGRETSTSIGSPLSWDEWESVAGCMRRVAHEVWDAQVGAIEVNELLSEESITQQVVVRLKQLLRRDTSVIVRSFNKHEEGNATSGKGADLAIWVPLHGGAYGLHFQAKSRLERGRFRSFQPAGRQHEQLVEAAVRDKANAAYLFYPAPHASAGASDTAADVRDYGCSAVCAYEHEGQLYPPSALINDLAAAWSPWHVFALATTWQGERKVTRPSHPVVAAPHMLPVRAAGLPTYLEDAKQTGTYTEATGANASARPQHTLVVEARTT